MEFYNVIWANVEQLPEGLDPTYVHDLDFEQAPKKIRSRRGKSYGFWRDRKGGWIGLTLVPTIPSVMSAVPWNLLHAEGREDGIDQLKFWKCLCDDRKHRIIAAPDGVDPSAHAW